MAVFTRYASVSLAGAAIVVVLSGAGHAGDYVSTNANGNGRCAAYGRDFAAVAGSDSCVRIGGHVRVDLSTNSRLDAKRDWQAGHASSAALRSAAFAPDVSPTHLRVHGGLEYPNPFH